MDTEHFEGADIAVRFAVAAVPLLGYIVGILPIASAVVGFVCALVWLLCTPRSKRAWEAPRRGEEAYRRAEEAWRRVERSKQGHRRNEVRAFVVDNGWQGKEYHVSTSDWGWAVSLPACLQVEEWEWPALVHKALASEMWSSTGDPLGLQKALDQVINMEIAKCQQGQPQQQQWHQAQWDQQQHWRSTRGRQAQPNVQGQQQQQQQWDQAPQWDQQQHWQGSRGRQGQHYTQEALSAMYARAAEQQPDLGSMSVAELQNFIQKSGSLFASYARCCSLQPELLTLAQHCMQLWECTRIIACSQLPHNSREQRLLAALHVLHVPTGRECGQPTAAVRSLTGYDRKQRFKKLELLVHPNNVQEHQRKMDEHRVAMKYLRRANAMLSKYNAAC